MVVLCSNASATTISTDTTWESRTGILDQTNGFIEITSGATLTANARVDHDGGIGDAGRVILNGGNFTSTDDYKFPDNNTGNPAFIGIYDGIFTANQFESFGLDRNATIEIGLAGTMIVQSGYQADFSNQSGGDQRRNLAVLIDTGALYASPGLTLNVQDLGGGAVRISAQEPGPELPTVGFTSAISSGLESSGTSSISVTLTNPEDGVVEVDYTVTGGTAARNSDYTLADGTLTLSAAQTTTNISITINDDASSEGAETVQITLSNPVNAVLGNPQHTFTIDDDDLYIISTPETWNDRTAILDQPGGSIEIVAGGSVTANARVDHDGGVAPSGRVILNGGDFTSTVDYKFPDNNTGDPAFIGIYDGIFTANQFESFGLDRNATIEIGINGTMIVETGYLADFSNQEVGERRRNLAALIDTGALFPSEGLTLNVEDLGGGGVRVTAVSDEDFLITNIEYDPDAVPSPTVTLTWTSRPGASYIALSSTNLNDWDNELGDSLDSDRDEIPDDGNQITATFPIENEANLFFRIEEE